MQQESLIEKIKKLPPEKLEEVADFVDLLAHRAARATRTQAIAVYAAECGGTTDDLDSQLEAAAIESLLTEEDAGQ
jgi:hypothetical protein